MSTTSNPHWYCREILGGPNHWYIRKILAPDGETYIDAPPIIVPPDILAARRAFAERYITEAKAALLGRSQTDLIQ